MKPNDTIEVSVDKLVQLYCNFNNGLNGKNRKSLWRSLFANQEPDTDIETYFATLKGQVVDIIDSGLKEKSGLSREMSPFVLKPDDVKKYLKS